MLPSRTSRNDGSALYQCRPTEQPQAPRGNRAREVGVASEPVYNSHFVSASQVALKAWIWHFLEQPWFPETEGSELQGSLEIVLVHLLMSRMANLRATQDKETEALVLF